MKKRLVLVEWDGDRSGYCGLNIELTVGKITLTYTAVYERGPQRRSVLARMRKRLKSLAEELGCEAEEKIFKS